MRSNDMLTACDSRDGMERALESLERLNTIVHERHVAGYANGQDMHAWILGGRWLFDEIGNSGVLGIGNLTPEETARLGLPLVASRGEFEAELRTRGCGQAYFASISVFLPPDGSSCPHCSERWNIDNAYLTKPVRVSDYHWVSGDPWVGQTWETIHCPKLMEDGFRARFAPTTLFVKGRDGKVRNPNMVGEFHVPYEHVIREGEELQFAMYHFVHRAGCRPN